MKKHLLALAICLLPIAGFAADETVKIAPNGTVTIESAGRDIRLIFHSLFTQAKKSYVLEPMPFQQIHLNLEGVDFEEALHIVCKLGSFKYELQNGIYFISKDPNAGKVDTLFTTKKSPETAPSGKLNHSVLGKKLTTHLQKTDIREVFAEFSKQTGIPIDVSASVPAYKLDAFLIDTSLKYSLDVITKAAGLKYRFSDTLSIEIYKPEPAKAPLQPGKSE